MGNLGVISFGFVAAGVAQQARFALCRFQPSQQNAKAPSWEGHGGDIAGHDPVAEQLTQLNTDTR